MSDHIYRLVIGLILISALYFENPYIIYGIIAVLYFEAITNIRIPCLLRKCRRIQSNNLADDGNLSIDFNARFNFEAERMLRMSVATLLLLTYVIYFDTVWFFPWFMGFALIGAGISGVCPMFLMLKWAGFR